MTHDDTHTGTLKTLTEIAALSLRLGQTPRATRHPDGERESDTTHTVMLALAAAWLVAHVPALQELRLERVLLYALVHDLPEALAGDVNTLHGLTPGERDAKREREERAVESIDAVVPWLATQMRSYERGEDVEADFVRYLDKIMPKLTHILDGGASLRLQGVTALHALEGAYTRQAATLASEYVGLADLHHLFAEAAEAARSSFASQQPALDAAFAPRRADPARLEEDPDRVWADFFCWARQNASGPVCGTLWSVEMSRPECTPPGLRQYRCPRCGAPAREGTLRAITPVDRAGYPIDRQHPLYGVTAEARRIRAQESLSQD